VKGGRIARLGFPSAPHGCETARVVSHVRALNFNNGGAEVAKQLRAIGAGDVLGQINYGYSVEGMRHIKSSDDSSSIGAAPGAAPALLESRNLAQAFPDRLEVRKLAPVLENLAVADFAVAVDHVR